MYFVIAHELIDAVYLEDGIDTRPAFHDFPLNPVTIKISEEMMNITSTPGIIPPFKGVKTGQITSSMIL